MDDTLIAVQIFYFNPPSPLTSRHYFLQYSARLLLNGLVKYDQEYSVHIKTWTISYELLVCP